MKIDNDHKYHGAALIQIAEAPQFTVINTFQVFGKVSRSAYRINDNIGVYLKYASKPKKPYGEYIFNFRQDHLDELSDLFRTTPNLFVALVCVDDSEICCISYSELMKMVSGYRAAGGGKKGQCNILVSIPEGKSCRVYVNAPGRRNTRLGEELIVARTDFPKRIFV